LFSPGYASRATADAAVVLPCATVSIITLKSLRQLNSCHKALRSWREHLPLAAASFCTYVTMATARRMTLLKQLRPPAASGEQQPAAAEATASAQIARYFSLGLIISHGRCR